MSEQPINLLELTRDPWNGDLDRIDQLPQMAQKLSVAITTPEVREWIEASPLSELDYTRLRWILVVVRRAKPPAPRRLTWRERITGRLKP